MTKLLTQKSYPPGVLRWAPGAELIRTSLGSVHVVGDVEHQLVLADVGEDMVDWLVKIDGHRQLPAEVAFAGSFGVEPTKAREILDYLLGAELLIAHDLEKASPKVSLVGENRGDELRQLLNIGEAAAYSLSRPSLDADWVAKWDEAIDGIGESFVVLSLSRSQPDTAEVAFSRRLVQLGVAHLVVGAGVQVARIGPLVADGGPCLRCEELARNDAEPSWSAISVQLATESKRAPIPPNGIRALVAAEAARHVYAYLAGEVPCSVGRVAESGYRGGTWRYRPVSRHHQCECWWPR